MGGVAPDADPIGIIELELLKLVRHLETFGRRSSLYVRVDRAGYLAMRTLDDLGPASANALAQALGLDASTVTRQVAALERLGFVERRANPADARSSSIALTGQGREIMAEVQLERRRHIEDLVRGWESEGRAGLGATLARLNGALVDAVSRLSPACADPGRPTSM
ncbi:MAG TPA: MarR family transcriptional regulator [Streptosporangiaceae bacterium]|jgi:DNA-binding MarR family transcriptional regulator